MSDKPSPIFEREVAYSEGGLSVRALEEMVERERRTQDLQVHALKTLRERNVDVQRALSDEVARLRDLSRHVARGKLGGDGLWTRLRAALARLPGLGGLITTRHSVEDLLRQQYETSARRVKEAASFAERLEGAVRALHAEIDRLNARIITSARDEKLAADHVLALRAHLIDLDARAAHLDRGALEARELDAQADRTRRALSEHSTQLKLFSTAADRLERLKDSTRLLAETIAHLRSDISQYVLAAGEKLDLVAGQIRAIGAAADASLVVIEMKRSLDSLGESLNETTRFVAETQAYFRANLDTLVADLEVFDAETRVALEVNLEMTRAVEALDFEDAVTLAHAAQARHSDAR